MSSNAGVANLIAKCKRLLREVPERPLTDDFMSRLHGRMKDDLEYDQASNIELFQNRNEPSKAEAVKKEFDEQIALLEAKGFRALIS